MSSVTPALSAEAPVERQPEARPHVHILPLDGVRGCAILLVLMGHLGDSISGEFGLSFPGFGATHLGWAGVDLFFVLSGFLITGILYDAKGRDGFFKTFYARRALRIFPLYYTAIIVTMILALLLPGLVSLGDQNSGWLFIYMTNFMAGASGSEDPFGVLTHFWSLAVEEHYYLVWPAIVFFFQRNTLMKIAIGAWVVAFIVRYLSIDETGHMTYFGYMTTFARMDALAAGSFVALAARGPGGIEALRKPALYIGSGALASFLFILIWRQTFYYSDPVLGTIGISTLWATFASLLVIALTWAPASSAASHPVLRWFGKYSYGMYVWHPIVIIIFCHTDWARSWRSGNALLDMTMQVGIAIAVLMAVTLLSWNFMEKQFLKMKRHFE